MTTAPPSHPQMFDIIKTLCKEKKYNVDIILTEPVKMILTPCYKEWYENVNVVENILEGLACHVEDISTFEMTIYSYNEKEDEEILIMSEFSIENIQEFFLSKCNLMPDLRISLFLATEKILIEFFVL